MRNDENNSSQQNVLGAVTSRRPYYWCVKCKHIYNLLVNIVPVNLQASQSVHFPPYRNGDVGYFLPMLYTIH